VIIIFLVKIKLLNLKFKNKIQWAFLKFSKIHEFKKNLKLIKSGFSIYALCPFHTAKLDHVFISFQTYVPVVNHATASNHLFCDD